NKVTCMNNLKQLAVAMNNYATTTGSFPPGIDSLNPPPDDPTKPPDPAIEDDMTWSNSTAFSYIVEYIDQDVLVSSSYSQWNNPRNLHRNWTWDTHEGYAVTGVHLKAMNCPSSRSNSDGGENILYYTLHDPGWVAL